MIPLLNAIFARFAALNGQFPGGLHRDRAPQGTALPFAVSKVVASSSELCFGTRARTRCQVRLAVYANGHDAAGELMRQLIAQFDGVLLTLSSGTHDSVARLGDPIPALLAGDGAGNDVWEWSVVFEFGVVG